MTTHPFALQARREGVGRQLAVLGAIRHPTGAPTAAACAPSTCSWRDLIADLAKAFLARRIRLVA